MGARGNIVVKESGGGQVVLYTHWTGFLTNEITAAALNSAEGRRRWGDEQYLARILFDHLTAGAPDKETGFGISSYVSHENYPPTVVDIAAQTVNGLPFEQFIRQFLSK